MNIAIARFGMPQPVLYKLPNEDKTLTLDEVMKMYPQGNQYAVQITSSDFIFFNNILGITKLIRRNEMIDPTIADLEKHQETLNQYLEAIGVELIEEQKKQRDEFLNTRK